MANVAYDNLKTLLMNNSLDLLNDRIQILLVNEFNASIITSAETLSSTVSAVSTPNSAAELTEVVGLGYTALGEQLSATVITSGSGVSSFSAADITWHGATFNTGGAIIYQFDIGVSPFIDIPLLYIDFGTNNSNSNGTFRITFNTEGVFTIT